MKTRVLHVINSLNTGGAETLLANSLAPGGLNEHTENFLLYFNKSSGLLNLIDKKVTVICLNYTGGSDLFRLLQTIRKTIIEKKIDIVHTHLTPAGVYTHLVCPPNVPQVHTIHSTYSMEKETRWFMRFIDRHLFLKRKRCNIISLSDFTRDDLLRTIHIPGKIFVLNNFVADRYFSLPPKQYMAKANTLRLVAAGTLKELKNFEYLLDVFACLSDRAISLDIFGEGDKTRYQTVIDNKNLNITMKGHIDDMSTVIQDYDLFIMPSKFEGFPLTVFEAMAAGVPLMLSDIAPLRSIVKDNAIYFPLDDASKVAGQLTGIRQNYKEIINMAVKADTYAKKTVRRDIYIKNLLEIYNQLLA